MFSLWMFLNEDQCCRAFFYHIAIDEEFYFSMILQICKPISL